MFRSVLTASVAAALLLTVAAPANAASRTCSNTPGGDVVSATNTTCREAHKLIRLWLAGFRRDGRTDRTVAKWTCRNRPNQYEGDVMYCSKGKRQRVRWYVNIPRNGASVSAQASARKCKTLTVEGLTVRVTISRGKVTCAKARDVIRRYYRGEGKKRGGPSNADTYYVIGKWRCGPGAGGVGCNNGKRYDTAESLIYGEVR